MGIHTGETTNYSDQVVWVGGLRVEVFCLGHTMECVWYRCMVWEGERGWLLFFLLSRPYAIECVVHGCDALNERSCACPMLYSHGERFM